MALSQAKFLSRPKFKLCLSDRGKTRAAKEQPPPGLAVLAQVLVCRGSFLCAGRC